MSPVVEAALNSWSIPPAATLALCVLAAVYLRGWRRLRNAGVPFVPRWRAISFVSGLFVLWLALASPLDTFSGFVLTAHMLQHMLLMMAAPPLILLGAPLVPLVRGLPDFAAREFAGPFLNWRVSKKVGRILASPICGLLLMGVVMFAWHVPRMYELALHSAAWHQVEHACFFIVAVIFWWPVVQPWPSRARWPRWAMVPYLLLADVQNTALCAILIFPDRVLYPSYAVMPRLFGSALEDQAAAGAMMWVVGSLAFVLPAIAITVEYLSSKASRRNTVPNSVSRMAIPISPFTFLPAMPLIGSGPRSRLRGRTVEAASFVVLFVAIGLCLAVLASSDASDADDQTLRFNGQSGPFLVAVFSQPGDLPTGHTNFGILVQDRDTHNVQLDATVDLSAVADSDTPGSSFSVRAVQAEGENKLLQTAELNLPSEGNWRMHVSVNRNSQTADFVLPIHVVREQTASEYLDRWPYIALVTFSAILLVVYVRRHRTARPEKVASRKVGARNVFTGAILIVPLLAPQSYREHKLTQDSRDSAMSHRIRQSLEAL
jgi:cytochrome c oxidase assembly factor CtaG